MHTVSLDHGSQFVETEAQDVDAMRNLDLNCDADDDDDDDDDDDVDLNESDVEVGRAGYEINSFVDDEEAHPNVEWEDDDDEDKGNDEPDTVSHHRWTGRCLVENEPEWHELGHWLKAGRPVMLTIEPPSWLDHPCKILEGEDIPPTLQHYFVGSDLDEIVKHIDCTCLFKCVRLCRNLACVESSHYTFLKSND